VYTKNNNAKYNSFEASRSVDILIYQTLKNIKNNFKYKKDNKMLWKVLMLLLPLSVFSTPLDPCVMKGSCAPQCWNQLSCPKGMTHYGDGSACQNNDLPRTNDGACDLSFCMNWENAGNAGLQKCILPELQRQTFDCALSGACPKWSWTQLPCPSGMKHYGDGSACTDGTNGCDLSYVWNPQNKGNGDMPKCILPKLQRRALACAHDRSCPSWAWINLPCPEGMTHYGDGSMCRGGQRQCDLGFASGSPNSNVEACPLPPPEKPKHAEKTKKPRNDAVKHAEKVKKPRDDAVKHMEKTKKPRDDSSKHANPTPYQLPKRMSKKMRRSLSRLTNEINKKRYSNRFKRKNMSDKFANKLNEYTERFKSNQSKNGLSIAFPELFFKIKARRDYIERRRARRERERESDLEWYYEREHEREREEHEESNGDWYRRRYDDDDDDDDD
jgi:hypothetical protein